MRESRRVFSVGPFQDISTAYQAFREIVRSGRLGSVIQIQSCNFNDWLQRPRLPPELDTSKGGGVVYRPGLHIADIVRFIGGGIVKTVRGVAGRADPHFDTEGHFSALLEFEDGVVATLSFNGYSYFGVAELIWNIGESKRLQTGVRAFPRPGKSRLCSPADPARKAQGPQARKVDDKNRRETKHAPFFGLTAVFCEGGAVRQSPDGLYVYTESGREEVPVAPMLGREAELTELAAAIRGGRRVFPDGAWGKATLEVCLAILASGRTGRTHRMRH